MRRTFLLVSLLLLCRYTAQQDDRKLSEKVIGKEAEKASSLSVPTVVTSATPTPPTASSTSHSHLNGKKTPDDGHKSFLITQTTTVRTSAKVSVVVPTSASKIPDSTTTRAWFPASAAVKVSRLAPTTDDPISTTSAPTTGNAVISNLNAQTTIETVAATGVHRSLLTTFTGTATAPKSEVPATVQIMFPSATKPMSKLSKESKYENGTGHRKTKDVLEHSKDSFSPELQIGTTPLSNTIVSSMKPLKEVKEQKHIESDTVVQSPTPVPTVSMSSTSQHVSNTDIVPDILLLASTEATKKPRREIQKRVNQSVTEVPKISNPTTSLSPNTLESLPVNLDSIKRNYTRKTETTPSSTTLFVKQSVTTAPSALFKLITPNMTSFIEKRQFSNRSVEQLTSANSTEVVHDTTSSPTIAASATPNVTSYVSGITKVSADKTEDITTQAISQVARQNVTTVSSAVLKHTNWQNNYSIPNGSSGTLTSKTTVSTVKNPRRDDTKVVETKQWTPTVSIRTTTAATVVHEERNIISSKTTLPYFSISTSKPFTINATTIAPSKRENFVTSTVKISKHQTKEIREISSNVTTATVTSANILSHTTPKVDLQPKFPTDATSTTTSFESSTKVLDSHPSVTTSKSSIVTNITSKDHFTKNVTSSAQNTTEPTVDKLTMTSTKSQNVIKENEKTESTLVKNTTKSTTDTSQSSSVSFSESMIVTTPMATTTQKLEDLSSATVATLIISNKTGPSLPVSLSTVTTPGTTTVKADASKSTLQPTTSNAGPLNTSTDAVTPIGEQSTIITQKSTTTASTSTESVLTNTAEKQTEQPLNTSAVTCSPPEVSSLLSFAKLETIMIVLIFTFVSCACLLSSLLIVCYRQKGKSLRKKQQVNPTICLPLSTGITNGVDLNSSVDILRDENRLHSVNYSNSLAAKNASIEGWVVPCDQMPLDANENHKGNKLNLSGESDTKL